MCKAISYMRFSPRADEATSQSNETQRRIIRDFCAAKNWPLAPEDEFADDALSGADADRPGLWAAIARIEKGDKLVVWQFDRLAREAFLGMSIERDVLAHGGSIVSATGQGTIEEGMTPEQKFLIGILRQADQYFREVSVIKTKSVMRQFQLEGRLMGSRPPVGTMIDPSRTYHCKKKNREMPMLKECPSELADLSRIRELADMEYNAGEITRILKAEGRTFRGAPWKLATIKKIMRGTRA